LDTSNLEVKVKQEKTKKKTLQDKTGTFLVAACVLVTLIFIWIYYTKWGLCVPFLASWSINFSSCELSNELEAWGQTGDFFGGLLNPVVGLTSVFLLLSTLRQNREALNTSKIELERSSVALSLQSQLMASEHRERAFVRMSDRLERIILKKFNVGTPDKEPPLMRSLKFASQDYLKLRNQNAGSRNLPGEIFFKQFKNQLPYLRALSEIFDLESDEHAKKMLSIHLLSATTPSYIEAAYQIMLTMKATSQCKPRPFQDEKLVSMLINIRTLNDLSDFEH
jgi:hypothetical protein